MGKCLRFLMLQTQMGLLETSILTLYLVKQLQPTDT